MDKVDKPLMIGKISLYISMIIFLSGCQFTLISPESAFEDAQEAMAEIDNLEITYSEKLGNEVYRGRYLLDIDKNEKWMELDAKDSFVYITEDQLFVQMEDMPVVQGNDTMLAWEFEEMIALLLNPFEELSEFDRDIIEKFDVKEEIKEITLSYDSEDKGMNRFAKNYLFFYVFSAEYLEEMDKLARDITIHDFSLEIILDAASYLPKQFKVKIIYEDFDIAPGEKMKVKNTYSYKNYDQIEDIPQLQMDETDNEDDIRTIDQENNEQIEITPADAVAHLEAIIYASIYQDIDEYIKRDPSIKSEQEKRKDGEEHLETFHASNKDVITEFIKEIELEDADVDRWVEAVFAGLSHTSFTVIDTKKVAENEFIVTLSISGIDEEQILYDTVQAMEKANLDTMTEDGFERIDMDILEQQYENSNTLDPVEVDIEIIVSNQGKFLTDVYTTPIYDTFIQ